MDASKMFACTIMHPKLFPGPITDPGNPLRVQMLVEVGAEGLIIRAPASNAKDRVLGREPLDGIDRISIERLDGGAQRQEILRRSLIRMALVGGVMLGFALFVRAYPPGISILMAVAVAAFVGPLNFLLNGGLARKQDIVRFHFFPTEDGRPFYLEVLPANELELHAALLGAGLRLEDGTGDQRMWVCGNCGAPVDATATTCPQCGAGVADCRAVHG